MTTQPAPLYTVTVRSPDGTEVVYNLGKNQGLLVGRDEACDVVLPSERISRRHARFFTEDEDLRVEDLDSETGVHVGGARVKGLQAIRPGPAIEIAEYQIRIRRIETSSEDASGKSSGQIGSLVGIGKQKGQRFELSEKMEVGRDRKADIVIQNDSVSRRHAQFSLEDGRLILRDLASSNGTFHNERPLGPGNEASLSANDIIGFGDTRFRFVAGAALPSASGGSRAAVLIGAFVLLIAGLVVFSQFNTSAVEYEDESYGEWDESPSQLARIRGDALAAEGDWANAVKAYEEALFEDPVAGDIRILLRKARSELREERQLAEVNRLITSGQPQPAFDLLLHLSPDSRAYTRARLVFRDLSGEVIRRSQTACSEAITARDDVRIVEHCGRYLNLSCHTQEVPENLLKALNKSMAKVEAGSSWACPSEFAHWFGGSSSVDTSDEQLRQQYPDEKLRKVVSAYYRGDSEDARREADKLSGTVRTQADELVRQMSLADSRFKEGSSALIANDLGRADRAFRKALELDSSVVATGTSALASRIRSTMGQAFARQGRHSFNQGQHTEAFAAWSSGLEYSPTDSQLLGGIRELEGVANSMANQGCPSLERAIKLTLPTSSTHERLTKKLNEECH